MREKLLDALFRRPYGFQVLSEKADFPDRPGGDLVQRSPQQEREAAEESEVLGVR